MDDLEALAKIVFNAGLELHKELGPGLLESVYEAVLSDVLLEQGLFVERQKIIPVVFRGKAFDEMFRADLIVENKLLIELKSTEHFAPVHAKQVLTYIRLAKLPLGFLMNFGQATFVGGFKRLANDYYGKIDG
ncbi:MAG: GxxExxY protein [Sphingorhabdus sp.]